MSDPFWYYQYDPIIDDHFNYGRFRSKINQYITKITSQIAIKIPKFKRNWVIQLFWRLVQGKEPDVVDPYVALIRSIAFDINYFIYQDSAMMLPEHIQLFQFWEYFLQRHLFEPNFAKITPEVMERIASLSPFEHAPPDIPFLTSTYPLTISAAITQNNFAQARTELKIGIVRNYIMIETLFRYFLPKKEGTSNFMHIFDITSSEFSGEIMNIRKIFEEIVMLVDAIDHNDFRGEKDMVIINNTPYPIVKLFSIYLNEMIFINGIQKVALNVLFNKKMGAIS